jgi:uncharacterized protein (TIGR02001 family)
MQAEPHPGDVVGSVNLPLSPGNARALGDRRPRRVRLGRQRLQGENFLAFSRARRDNALVRHRSVSGFIRVNQFSGPRSAGAINLSGVNNMKQVLRGVAVLALTGAAATAQAEGSINVGWDSDYIFRGIEESDSSVNGGVDWKDTFGDSDFGYYVGTWAADVDLGLEIDYYGGLTAGLGDFDLTAGYTYYDYTDDFDDTYKEFNLGVDWKFLSFSAVLGEYDNFGDEDQDYQYYELTAEHNGFFATVGSFHDDFDGEFIKLGYGTALAGVDVTAYYVYSNSDLVDGVGDINGSDQSFVLQVNKSFSWQQVQNAWRGLQQ